MATPLASPHQMPVAPTPWLRQPKMSQTWPYVPWGAKPPWGGEPPAYDNYLQQMSPPVRVLQQRWLHLQHVTLSQLGTEKEEQAKGHTPSQERQVSITACTRTAAPGPLQPRAWSAHQRHWERGSTWTALSCPFC